MSDDPRQRFLSALKRELRGGPLARRRVLAEITAHLDDTVAELTADGLAEDTAGNEALRRLGDLGTTPLIKRYEITVVDTGFARHRFVRAVFSAKRGRRV